MSSRHRSREQALQILYLWDMRRQQAPTDRPSSEGAGEKPRTEPFTIREAIEALHGLVTSEPVSVAVTPPDPFTEELITGVASQEAAIDGRILEQSKNWRLERMSVVDRNILRLAVYEMLYLSTPAPIVIDEALELAQRFSGTTSVSFINGVLDAVWQKREA